MVGNIERSRYPPALNPDSAHENPISVHSQSTATPRRGAGRKRRRVTLRFEKRARVDALLSRQSVEISENDRRHCRRLRFGSNNSELGQLSVDRSVWIDVRVEETQFLWSNRDCCRDRESRPPLTFMPRQIDARNISHRQTTQQRHSRIAHVVQIDWLFKVEPPLTFDRRHSTRNSGRLVGPLHVHFRGQFFSNMMTTTAFGAFVGFL